MAELHGITGGNGRESMGKKDGNIGAPCSNGAKMASGAWSDTVKDIRSAAGTICPPGRKTWLSMGSAPISRGGTASIKRVCGRRVPPRIALDGKGPGAGGRVNGLNVKGTRSLFVDKIISTAAPRTPRGWHVPCTPLPKLQWPRISHDAYYELIADAYAEAGYDLAESRRKTWRKEPAFRDRWDE